MDNNIDNILYICIKLDNESKTKLKELVTEVFNDDYCKLFCDHLTLAFGRECELFDMDLIGEKVTLVSGTIAFNDRIAALVVDRGQVEQYGVNNKHPHITLATFDRFTRPVYSNQMLGGRDEDYETVSFKNDPVELSGEIVSVPKSPSV